MGWIETGVKCKNHPDESQQPGVCSSCLRERLSQISTRSVSTINYSCSSSSPSSSPPPYSSSYFSASTSPSRRHHHRRGRHHRHHSVVMSTISHMRSGVDGLKKSRSIAAVVRKHRVAAAGEVESRREKKSGFWSKLIPSTGKRI